ncbi:MAG TPA: hypothetical protein VFB96_04165 [Pirellulaceae bacterium]|nr:hypothetical protein [Pirellulaceae bacterium]
MRFTIRDLLWLTVVVAMALGWWATYRAGVRAATQEEVWKENSVELGAVLRTANVLVTFDADGTMRTKHMQPQLLTNPIAPAPNLPSD